MRNRLLARWLVALFVLVSAVAVAGGTLLHGRGQAHGAAAAPVVAASRGDIVATVGGVGRIVGASSGQIAVPSPAPGAASAPADAVFPSVTGRVERVLVNVGTHVRAGQLIALLQDDGSAAVNVAQARSDLASARLELAQKRTSDPTKGTPPSFAELAAAQLAVRVAAEKLGRPNQVDVTSSRFDLLKARSDLEVIRRAPSAATLSSAKLAVYAAEQRLAQANGRPPDADLAAATLELTKASAELEALQAAPAPPTATALEAAQLAVDLAKQRLAELDPTGPASDRLAAQLELKKAQADLEALQRKPAPPTATALAAAQQSVDVAKKKLDQLNGAPSASTVASARLDLAKAKAELEALRFRSAAAMHAAQLGVDLAAQKLHQLRHPPASIRDAARLELAKARVELETLRKRGAPAGTTDLAIAGLKVQAAKAHLTLALNQARRLSVLAPVAGTVTSVFATPGAPVDTSTPVATVANLGRLAVSVDLSEFDAAHVQKDQPALVSVDALGGKTYPGTVLFEAFSGVENAGVVTFPVRVALRHVAGVKPGMNVSVRIVVAKRYNVIRVPLEAVSHEGGEPTVTVVGPSGTSTKAVVLGLSNNKDVEIKHGLQAGQRVELTVAGGTGD